MNNANALVKNTVADTLHAVIGSLGHITQSLLFIDEKLISFENQDGELATLCQTLGIKQIKGLSHLTECAMIAVEEGYSQLRKEQKAHDAVVEELRAKLPNDQCDD